MTQIINNYAKALYQSNIKKEQIKELERIFNDSSILVEVFSNPTISKSEKISSMKKIFDESVWGFISVLIEQGDVDLIFDIIKSYKWISTRKDHVTQARLICVTEPDDKHKHSIIDYIKKINNANDVELEIVIDNSIIGGFIIQVGDFECDMSLKSKIKNISQKLSGDVMQ